MTNRESGLTAEQEARWDRARAEASALDRRRYYRLHPLDRLHILVMIPAGAASTLREACALGDGGFEEWRSRQG